MNGQLSIRKVRQGPVDGVKPRLVVEDLCVKVGMRKVIRNLSFEVFPGDELFVTGPNGVGKSTLLNAIAGIEPARVVGGRMRLDGDDIGLRPAHERANMGLVYMRQRDHVFPSLTVAQNLELALGGGGYERFAVAYPEWAHDLPPNRRAGLLSGGQKKKLAWGMTVLRSPRLLLLDEPEAGLSDSIDIGTFDTYMIVSHNSMQEH